MDLHVKQEPIDDLLVLAKVKCEPVDDNQPMPPSPFEFPTLQPASPTLPMNAPAEQALRGHTWNVIRKSTFTRVQSTDRGVNQQQAFAHEALGHRRHREIERAYATMTSKRVKYDDNATSVNQGGEDSDGQESSNSHVESDSNAGLPSWMNPDFVKRVELNNDHESHSRKKSTSSSTAANTTDLLRTKKHIKQETVDEKWCMNASLVPKRSVSVSTTSLLLPPSSMTPIIGADQVHDFQVGVGQIFPEFSWNTENERLKKEQQQRLYQKSMGCMQQQQRQRRFQQEQAHHQKQQQRLYQKNLECLQQQQQRRVQQLEGHHQEQQRLKWQQSSRQYWGRGDEYHQPQSLFSTYAFTLPQPTLPLPLPPKISIEPPLGIQYATPFPSKTERKRRRDLPFDLGH